MSEYRQLNRSFWESDYVQEELDSDGRLVYVYLITSPKSNMEGLYKCSMKRLTDETIHDKKRVRKVLSRLEADGYAGWLNGWVCVVQATEHFPVKNKTVLTHARKLYAKVPDAVVTWAVSLGYVPVCPIDRLLIGPRTRLDNTIQNETANDTVFDTLRAAVDLAPNGGAGHGEGG